MGIGHLVRQYSIYYDQMSGRKRMLKRKIHGKIRTEGDRKVSALLPLSSWIIILESFHFPCFLKGNLFHLLNSFILKTICYIYIFTIIMPPLSTETRSLCTQDTLTLLTNKNNRKIQDPSMDSVSDSDLEPKLIFHYLS